MFDPWYAKLTVGGEKDDKYSTYENEDRQSSGGSYGYGGDSESYTSLVFAFSFCLSFAIAVDRFRYVEIC